MQLVKNNNKKNMPLYFYILARNNWKFKKSEGIIYINMKWK